MYEANCILRMCLVKSSPVVSGKKFVEVRHNLGTACWHCAHSQIQLVRIVKSLLSCPGK